jgi:hypothetical protein
MSGGQHLIECKESIAKLKDRGATIGKVYVRGTDEFLVEVSWEQFSALVRCVDAGEIMRPADLHDRGFSLLPVQLP